MQLRSKLKLWVNDLVVFIIELIGKVSEEFITLKREDKGLGRKFNGSKDV